MAAAVALGLAALAATPGTGTMALRLPVPVIRQAPERCGPAALRMVLAYYGADEAHQAHADSAYDPVLRGSLITDLARAAERAGFTARVDSLPTDSLAALLARGIPPIVLFLSGVGPIARGHFGVVVGSAADGGRFELQDGGASAHGVKRPDLERRWRPAGHLALIVSPAVAGTGP